MEIEEDIDEPVVHHFDVNENHILKNGNPFFIKGVVYVPGYPGFLPWEIESSTSLPPALKNYIRRDLANIRNMGANTVRFWGAPKFCYEALKEAGDLYFLQTIWIKGDAPDFQDETFKRETKTYIRQVIDRIYSVFESSPPLVAILVGNELSEQSILATDAAHSEITSYQGENFSISGITATEAFLAEMADYTRNYELDKYGNSSLLSYANEIRTVDLIDASFLDFVSHNAYSYAVPYYRPQTSYGSASGTKFQGWIEEIKSKHTNKPLLITETGLSVSPDAYHVGPPNYGYGGNTEAEQAAGLLQNIEDINTSLFPNAGVCIHEYLDAWWKFGLEDSYSQDPKDVEEWFGLVKLLDAQGVYNTEFRASYRAVKEAW